MLLPDISTTTPIATFSLVSQRATSSLRSDAAQPVDEPRTLTVSHEVQTNGKVSTAVFLDDVGNVSSITNAMSSSVRVLLKFQYNPLEGRTDLDTVVPELITQLVEILESPNFVDKLMNKEH